MYVTAIYCPRIAKTYVLRIVPGSPAFSESLFMSYIQPVVILQNKIVTELSTLSFPPRSPPAMLIKVKVGLQRFIALHIYRKKLTSEALRYGSHRF